MVKVALVYNPRAGSALPLSELKKKFAEHGILIERTIAFGENLPQKLSPLIKRAATIAVVGGDGTISAVASQVAGTKAVLAPLPGGTLNHFTKDLGVPQQLDDAIAALKNKRPRKVDVATVNGKTFVNNSSIGLYPSSLRERNRLEDRLGKWPAAVIASIRTMARLKDYEVSLDSVVLKTRFVFIGNNRYGLSTLGLPGRKRIDAGILTVFAARRVSPWSLAKLAALTLIGRAYLLNDFDIRTTKDLTIASKRRHVSVSLDGELAQMEMPLRYEIKPGALRILG